MSRERALVVLVAADVFLAFAGIGVDAFFGWTLPGALRDYVRGSGSFNLRQFGLLVLWGLTAACAITAWVGLVSRWWFARRLYVIACAASTVLLLFSGPSVSTPVGAMLDRLNWLVGGAILGLVYFSELSRSFERRPAPVANGATAGA
jgi:hypothetical protein